MKRTTHRVLTRGTQIVGRIVAIAAVSFILCAEDGNAQPLLLFGSANTEASAFGPNGIALGDVVQNCSEPTCSVSIPAASRFGSPFSGFASSDISSSLLSIAAHNTF